jgi:glycosyltransferase involved in cell wall biosynthesis
MRILVVASYNRGLFAPFIVEQAEAISRVGCEIGFCGVKGKGMKGYLMNLLALKKEISSFCPDVIHAHYGLSGLLANLQREVPVVTTYHGSDINDKKVLPFSKMALRLSAWNIFVSQKTMLTVGTKRNCTLLPCGIDLCNMQLTEKNEARRLIGLEAGKVYVLFAGAFDNLVKNAALAKETVGLLHDNRVELLELKGYSREQVNLLMCAANAFLLTSFSEGSPQVIKEAMACGCPIVSVEVGDIKERIEGLEGCFVSTKHNAQELAVLLQKALSFEGRTQGREKLMVDGLDNNVVAQQLVGIYKKVVSGENS